jgi:hypothetical protein
MAIPANLAKAYLQIEGGDRIECWFNPTEYTVSKANTWKVDPVVGESTPPAQFGGGNPQKISLDLLFDDTEATDGDVRSKTDALFAAMEVDRSTATGKNSARPPMITFGWGTVTLFKAVADSLSVQYMLFRPDGTPIRAQVKLSLIQAQTAVGKAKPQGKRKTNPTTRAIEGYRTHVMIEGETLHSVAHRMYGDATRWRTIAEANGIDDPMHVRRGTVLDIPILP